MRFRLAARKSRWSAASTAARSIAGRPGPVEGVHRGEAAEAAAEEATFEAALGPGLLFAVDEVFEQLGRAPAALGGQGDEVVQVGGGVVEAEERERVREWGHRAPPVTSGG